MTNRRRNILAHGIVMAVALVVLLWTATPTIHEAVPLWVIVDLLVGQFVLASALLSAALIK
jgi:hypothetical protein